MCSPTYPVFRSGKVLRAERDIDPDTAVSVAKLLRDAHIKTGELFRKVILAQGSDFELVKSKPGPDEAAWPRTRLFPAVTLDFPPCEFVWHKVHKVAVEFRVCITVCVDGKRAKIWTRYNCIDVQKNAEVIREFYDAMEKIDDPLQEEYARFYNEILMQFKNKLDWEYDIRIRMLSTKDQHVRALTESSPPTDPANDAVGGAPAGDVSEILGIIAREFAIELPPNPESATRKLVTFNYPRNDPDAGKKDGVPAADEDFNAVGVVDIDDKGISIVGLAYEEKPPSNFRRSAPHVISGEISYQVGNSY